MARTFVRASSQSLTHSGNIVTAYPLTLVCWAKATDVTAGGGFQDVVWIGNGGSAANDAEVKIGFDTAGKIRAVVSNTGTSGIATSTTAATNNVWCHLAGVFTSATSRTVYRDGANSATNTTNLALPTVSTQAISSRRIATPDNFLGGDAMEAAIWSVALDASEIAALAVGVSPLLIRPTSLAAYWPLFGNDSPEPDRWNGRFDLTLNNTPTKGDHSRIYKPHMISSF